MKRKFKYPVRMLIMMLLSIFLISCDKNDSDLSVLGTINGETIYCEDAVVVLQQKKTEYEQQLDAFGKQFSDETIDSETLNQNFREEAYESLIMDYLLSQYAVQQKEALSEEQQKENEYSAEILLKEFQEQNDYGLHFTRTQILNCINHGSLAGIYFGTRMEDYEAVAEKEIFKEDYENEEEFSLAVQSRGYRYFQEDYQKLKEEADIRLDQKLWEKYCAFFQFD